MNIPIADIFDRFTILRLKKERLGRNKVLNKQFSEYEKELNKILKKLDTENLEKAQKFLGELLEINKSIWDLEHEIRAGLEEKITLEEIGRRALLIRNHNGLRGKVKNKICEFFEQRQYLDVKVDHVAEDLFKNP